MLSDMLCHRCLGLMGFTSTIELCSKLFVVHMVTQLVMESTVDCHCGGVLESVVYRFQFVVSY